MYVWWIVLCNCIRLLVVLFLIAFLKFCLQKLLSDYWQGSYTSLHKNIPGKTSLEKSWNFVGLEGGNPVHIVWIVWLHWDSYFFVVEDLSHLTITSKVLRNFVELYRNTELARKLMFKPPLLHSEVPLSERAVYYEQFRKCGKNVSMWLWHVD